jgi:hypothetical protein
MTMMKLIPYGSTEHAASVAKVGKSKTPFSLARRMPSPEIVAKVGASVGQIMERPAIRVHRVVRLNAPASLERR